MLGKKGNSLIVIENGKLTDYRLDDKLVWEVGRPSRDNNPDIILHSVTVSRQHGKFQNIDGMWFYLDKKGKNGTVYNGKHVSTGIRGRIKPISLKNGDILIFGGGEEAVINNKTVWTMYLECVFDERWRVEDTKGVSIISLSDEGNITILEQPSKGTVVKGENGLAIYMGDVTYLIGNIVIKSN